MTHPASTTPALREWVVDHVRPFPPESDELPTALRDARVVGIASAVRTARESVRATHALVSALLDAGFRAVMIEGVDAVASDLDRHVHTGDGDPAALLAEGQGFVRNTEHLDLVASLRRWNLAHPGDTVSIVDDRHGATPRPGSLAEVEQMLAARDLAWHRATGERVVHCGGTAHVVAGDPRTVPPAQTHVNAGGLLRRELGSGYAVVALTVGSGRAPFEVPAPPADFWESAFSDLGDRAVLLDLAAHGTVPVDGASRLDAPLRTRMIGPGYEASHDRGARVDAGVTRTAVDVVVHLPTITPVTPLP